MRFVKNNIKVIILTGKAGSGKNTVASIIKEKLINNKAIILEYTKYLKEYAMNISGWNGDNDTKPRTLLQELGVELIKNKIDSKLLINRMLEDIEVYSYFFDTIIISDTRFIDEIDCIKNKYNNVIVINIKGCENKLTSEQKKHITETALDDYNLYNYIIDNNNDIVALERQVIAIINKEFK